MPQFQKIRFPETASYSSDSMHIPFEFYEQAFPKSIQVDMVLGYFSTNAIRTLAASFAEFIFNDGSIRIVTNHLLSQEDKDHLIVNTTIANQDRVVDIFKDMDDLRTELGPQGLLFFDCLKYLLASGRLQIQPVMHKPNALAHYKKVIFFDGTDHMYINGSANFTYSGLLVNGESFNVDRSWASDTEKRRINAEIANFDLIFSKSHVAYDYLDADKVKGIISSLGEELNIQQLLEKAKDLLDDDSVSEKVRTIYKKRQKEFDKKLAQVRSQPSFPHKEGPRPYQLEAMENWINNGKQGIFSMATGTGKTLTSLNCLLHEYAETKRYRAVILVPTIALVGQWKKECRGFNFQHVLEINSRNKWPSEISFINSASGFTDNSFIIIVTYASFHRKNFQDHFAKLPSDTLLIADEAHNLGSPRLLSVLGSVKLQKRIGLSATIDRKYDEVGNLAIDHFFNDKAPYIFDFSMEQAMALGWLCRYKYYPHIVKLTALEMEQYRIKSRELMKYFDAKTGTYRQCDEVEMLLLERKRIIHKAENKLNTFRRIIETEFDRRGGDLRYTLVYVPEGVEANYDEQDEDIEETEDVLLIDEYTRAVRDVDPFVTVKQYTAKTPDREQAIVDFGAGRINVLTSMKCLDEGVDVPRAELAIFCASTGNPRQFIQRRGRVLRKHDNKKLAIIHDLVVVPEAENDETFEMEKNLIKKELERVVNFSNLSSNKPDSYNNLKEILDHYNINLFDE